MSEEFIHKIEEVVLRNLSNEKFGVLDLAKEVGFSRSQTTRKIKKFSGKSVNQFIREIRLREACKMFSNENLTAFEIACKVGFSSSSYFNKCFLDQYGITPGEFKKRIDEGDTSEFPDLQIQGKWWRRKPIWIALFLLVVVLVMYILVVF